MRTKYSPDEGSPCGHMDQCRNFHNCNSLSLAHRKSELRQVNLSALIRRLGCGMTRYISRVHLGPGGQAASGPMRLFYRTRPRPRMGGQFDLHVEDKRPGSSQLLKIYKRRSADLCGAPEHHILVQGACLWLSIDELQVAMPSCYVTPMTHIMHAAMITFHRVVA